MDGIEPTISTGATPKPEVQMVDAVWLGKWLGAFQAQQQLQTKYLQRIAGVATLIAWLIAIAFIVTFLSVMFATY